VSEPPKLPSTIHPSSQGLSTQKNIERSLELMLALETNLNDPEDSFPWAPLWASLVVTAVLVGIAYRLEQTPIKPTPAPLATATATPAPTTTPVKAVAQVKPEVPIQKSPEKKTISLESIRSRLISQNGQTGGLRYHVHRVRGGIEITIRASWFFSKPDGETLSSGKNFIQNLVNMGMKLKNTPLWEIKDLDEVYVQKLINEFKREGVSSDSIHFTEGKNKINIASDRFNIQLLSN
jgi:hypothetical protein